ncbi:hypothetical protein ID0177_08200 [Helicobacter pylori]
MITTINLEAMSARVICLKVAGDSVQNKKTLCDLELDSLCKTKDCTRNNE